jgi:quercetin dioxygenase-like cupin family protein
MAFDVFDFRTDTRNVVVTPELRGRFLRMEPGEVGPSHSHDLGHEVFIVLEGKAEFLIEDHRAVLGPGQMCFARAGELHEVRVIGDAPMTLFLAVTPHLEPTHTFWDAQGRKLPPVYGYWTPAGLADQTMPTDPLPLLATRHLAAARTLAETLAAQSAGQVATVAALEERLAADDLGGAKGMIDNLWSDMHETYVQFQLLMTAWNELALAVGQRIATK